MGVFVRLVDVNNLEVWQPSAMLRTRPLSALPLTCASSWFQRWRCGSDDSRQPVQDFRQL